MGVHKANVTITERKDLNIWDVYVQASQPLDNVTIDSIMESMLIATQGKLDDNQLIVLENVMDEVINVADKKPYVLHRCFKAFSPELLLSFDHNICFPFLCGRQKSYLHNSSIF